MKDVSRAAFKCGFRAENGDSVGWKATAAAFAWRRIFCCVGGCISSAASGAFPSRMDMEPQAHSAWGARFCSALSASVRFRTLLLTPDSQPE